MDNLDQLHAALIKADAAGDTAGAKILADHIRAVSAAPASAPAPGLAQQANSGLQNYILGRINGAAVPIGGVAQLLAHGAASAAHAVAPGSAIDKWAGDASKSVDNFNTTREKLYQLLTPGSVAAGMGNIQSQIAMPIKGIKVAQEAGAMAKALAATGTGAAVGATQPVYGAGAQQLADGAAPADYWSEKAKQIGLGAALGGGMSGMAAAGGSVVNALRPVISPKAAVGDQLISGLAKAKAAAAGGAAPDPALAGVMGSRDPAAVLDRLRNAAPLVDGSLPTTAQVAGVPELVMAEKVLKNNPAYRGPFEDRAIANNQARLAQLLSVAKTPGDLQAATAARTAEAAPLYDAAKAATLPVDDALTELLARPSAQQAIARGKKLASERGEKVDLDAATPAAAPSPSGLLDASGNPIMSQGAPAQAGTISGNMLQYMKMGLDDMQSAGRTQGIGSHEAGALSDTQGALQSWIEKNSPDYLAANQAYAKASQPINTMQAAQDLYGGLSSGTMNAAGDVSPMLSQYRTQLARALKSSPYGIEPGAQKSLEAIQDDLQRETISNSIKSSGSDSVFNLQAPNWLSGQLFGNKMDGKSPTAMALGGLIGGGGTMGMAALGGGLGAQKVGQFVGNRVNGEFQKAMLDPQYFAKLLGEALDRQSAAPSTLQQLLPVGTRGATVGAENTISP